MALAARYDGHFMPAVTIRLGAAWAALNGGGVGVLGAVDVMPGSARDGQTCPLGETCVRPVLHLGAGDVPYARETVLVGPGTQRVSEGTVSGDLGLLEVGGGVTVVPAGTGDALRFSLMAAGVLGFRGEETLPTLRAPLSQATARFGASTELLGVYRIVGPLGVHLGARLQWFPGFADVGRRFSFLGDATRTGESASLLQVVVQAGLGVEL